MTTSPSVERLPTPNSVGHLTPSTPALFGTRVRGDVEPGALAGGPDEWRDLAPEIIRQRLVIEGVPAAPIRAEEIRRYLSELSQVIDMVQLIEPVTHCSDLYGWAGWIHWETSGAHFYAWERPRLFFSVDVYTCKAFAVDTAVSFTRDFFQGGPVVAKSF
jgi:S-adenosylmethionine decarboxylase